MGEKCGGKGECCCINTQQMAPTSAGSIGGAAAAGDTCVLGSIGAAANESNESNE